MSTDGDDSPEPDAGDRDEPGEPPQGPEDNYLRVVIDKTPGRWLIERAGSCLSDPQGRRGWLLAAGTTAVVALSITVGALVASKGPHRQMTKDALPVGVLPGQGGGPAARADPDETLAGGDLGDVADRASLVARVKADLQAEYQRRAAQSGVPGPSGPQSGVPGPSGPQSGVPGPSPASGSAPVQATVGSRPCEVEARGDPGDRGEVVYEATALHAGTAGVVLAFGSAQGADPITVEMRAQSDCRRLLQGAIL